MKELRIVRILMVLGAWASRKEDTKTAFRMIGCIVTENEYKFDTILWLYSK